jgi:adenylate cyclase
MAYWNAPQQVKDHPDKAVTSALQQLKKLESLNKELKKTFGITLEIGIGIHTGLVVVGEIGSSDRSDYTVIGDSVNLTSRLESLNKFYGTSLIISEQTKKQLRKEYILRELGQVRVKGKSEVIRIYEVLQEENQTNDLTIELSLYHDALAYYYHKDFKTAYDLFDKLYKDHPHKLYYYYQEQSQFYLNHKDQVDLFDGIHYIDMK